MKELSLIFNRAQSRAESAVLIFAFSILMGLLARLAVPLPFTPVPVTGQTLGVLLAGAVLGGPRAAAAMLLYLVQGLLGLPVFSPAGPGGPAHLLGPTAGFLLSYPLAALVVGQLAVPAGQRGLSGRRLLLAFLCGEAVIFLGGAVWLAAWMRGPLSSVWQAAVWPFLPGELLKVALAFALVKYLGGRGRR